MPRLLMVFVHDEPAGAAPLVAALARDGHDVAVARGEAPALAAVRDARPDLVLLDTGEPGVDGLELLRRLRRDTPDLRVIVLTAAADVELARMAIKLGAADCLFTPVDPDRLRGAVERDLDSPPIAARR
jgi:DNA-binding NtrC family response regulator